MSVESRFVPAEYEANMRPDNRSPAELIFASPTARQADSDFMWQYAGDPEASLTERQARQPQITRSSYDGGSLIAYHDTQISGYTGLGSLVHVRMNQEVRECPDRYFVAIAELAKGKLEEYYVVDTRHEHTVATGLETVLYLAHEDNASWPQEYWPSLRLTQRGFFYSPGFENREERIKDIAQLHRELDHEGRSERHLRSVE